MYVVMVVRLNAVVACFMETEGCDESITVTDMIGVSIFNQSCVKGLSY